MNLYRIFNMPEAMKLAINKLGPTFELCDFEDDGRCNLRSLRKSQTAIVHNDGTIMAYDVTGRLLVNYQQPGATSLSPVKEFKPLNAAENVQQDKPDAAALLISAISLLQLSGSIDGNVAEQMRTAINRMSDSVKNTLRLADELHERMLDLNKVAGRMSEALGNDEVTIPYDDQVSVQVADLSTRYTQYRFTTR